MSVAYDERIIAQFAAQLYRRASSMVLVYVIAGVIAGAATTLGVVLTSSAGSLASITGMLAVVGGLLGWLFGTQRAIALRLMAQTALCQMQIERNTRPGRIAVTTAPSYRPPSLPDQRGS